LLRILLFDLINLLFDLINLLFDLMKAIIIIIRLCLLSLFLPREAERAGERKRRRERD